jgi:hypothetical protein
LFLLWFYHFLLHLQLTVSLKILKKDFWTNISDFYDQPIVKFNNEFMLYVLQNGQTQFYSSVMKLNDYNDNIINAPLIRVRIHSITLDRIPRYK